MLTEKYLKQKLHGLSALERGREVFANPCGLLYRANFIHCVEQNTTEEDCIPNTFIKFSDINLQYVLVKSSHSAQYIWSSSKNKTGKADLTTVSRLNQLYLVSLVFIRGFCWLPPWLAIIGTNNFLLWEQLSLVQFLLGPGME